MPVCRGHAEPQRPAGGQGLGQQPMGRPAARPWPPAGTPPAGGAGPRHPLALLPGSGLHRRQLAAAAATAAAAAAQAPCWVRPCAGVGFRLRLQATPDHAGASAGQRCLSAGRLSLCLPWQRGAVCSAACMTMTCSTGSAGQTVPWLASKLSGCLRLGDGSSDTTCGSLTLCGRTQGGQAACRAGQCAGGARPAQHSAAQQPSLQLVSGPARLGCALCQQPCPALLRCLPGELPAGIAARTAHATTGRTRSGLPGMGQDQPSASGAYVQPAWLGG